MNALFQLAQNLQSDVTNEHSQQLCFPETMVTVIAFHEIATFLQPPVPVHLANPMPMACELSTNEAAGLHLAQEAWMRVGEFLIPNIILMGDGAPNRPAVGGVEAAEEQADSLKAKGARVATVAFDASRAAKEHLMRVATMPSLYVEAEPGKLVGAFRQSTQRLATDASGNPLGEHFIFVMDCSASMTGSKSKEAEAALISALRLLQGEGHRTS